MFATSLAVSFFLAALPQDKPAPAPDAPAAHEAWIADFDAAAKVAKEKGKDVLVDFTGSDWCIWCKRLHDEVFAHEEFLKAAEKDYVLCALDFEGDGSSKKDQPNPTRNEELRDKFEVRGFPTVLLLTPEGELFGRTGYAPGGPEKYVEALNGMRESGKKLLAELGELTKKFEAAQGEEKGKILDDLIARLEGLDGDSPFAGKLAAMVHEAFKLDPENKQGRKLKATNALVKVGMIDDEVIAAGTALDPKNEQGLLEKVVAARCKSVQSEEQLKEIVKVIDELDALGPIKDKETGLAIYLNAAFWNFRFLSQPEAAKKYAQKAKDLGIENPRASAMIDQILGS